MPYVPTFNRDQMMFCSWDSFVETDSIARLIDAFVDSLDLTKYHVKEAAKEGRPPYDPKGMYKLYIYGSRKGIRSSRKLGGDLRSCCRLRKQRYCQRGMRMSAIRGSAMISCRRLNS